MVCVMLWSTLAGAQEVAGARASARSVDRILGLTPKEPGKCGTSALVLAYSRWSELGAQTQQAVIQALQRPEKQKSRKRPFGHFRIHYDTTGVGAPALISAGPAGQRITGTAEQFIDSVDAYFESVWKLEIDTLGYGAPPADGVQGGGPEYDIYVEELGTDMFGQTFWNQSADLLEDGSRQRFSSYIEIDNDFAGYRTPGMDGLRVTAAHEFFHAIQLGSYGVWTTVPRSDFYFYELSSVWMEHVAFPGIHDYYYYLPKYFRYFRDAQNRSLSFTKFDETYRGYERAVWAHFLSKRFGRDVLRQIWNGMKQSPVLTSTSVVLQQNGTSINQEFAQFSIWNYFTADRADPHRFYDEGQFYPRYEPNASADFFGSQASIASSAPAMSTQLYQFVIPSDTITAVVTNRDVASAQVTSPPMSDLSLQMKSSGMEPPYQLVAGGIGISFKSADADKWSRMYLRSSTRSNAVVSPGAAPNPLRLSKDTHLILPVSGGVTQPADVYFLNSALERVFARQYDIRQSFGISVVEVPVADILTVTSTGVYFVVAKCGSAQYKWKVAIFQ